ncbi:MAG TPA: ankyrin repeat domain-containing protein [Bryobacteraceae bacterium]|nr:ankyrin repeat domain-containing protein [Bryobacteraceae bacterium]
MSCEHAAGSTNLVDLYQVVGGRETCRQLSKAFYARVERDPVLRPLFPGKTLRCAIDAFAAFLAQFLGGPAEDAEQRWFLSLRESHRRFKIGPREREAWLGNMAKALDDVPIEGSVRLALRELFERSSAYLVNSGQDLGEMAAAEYPADDGIRREMTARWDEQRGLDDLTAAIRNRDRGHVRALIQSPTLQRRFARDRAVFAHALALIMETGDDTLLEYAGRQLRDDPSLAQVRNRYGRALIHDASAQGNLQMLELLLRLGADPNMRTAGGHTPLYCLANQCRLRSGGQLVRVLVRAGANVDARSDSKQCTALHMAARRGNTDVAEALLDCGADMNARDKSGDTPLRRAKNCRKAAVASLLVSRGAAAP